MKCLEGMGLAGDCAIVTNGRFSGSNRGLFVGHISPEAYEGGPLALVKDGDKITIDLPNRDLHLHVDGQELKRRKDVWVPPEKELLNGYLKTYCKISKSAAEGAVVE
ncbi:dihydroxy-acid dehydratase [Marasmitruncus massiliensis]|uniref:dihydroxy-acid dehydratase domain-containing protein n=1 Tax=Marasmitruncus massiliensis TaxID=1944642 RepID=UPI000C7A8ADD|nr:dihydroxy-acid dehydratase [Marasmitruncus massiliensis]